MRKKYFVVIILFSSLLTAAQVPVRDEPRHHNVFENSYVRLLDVFLSPHDTTQFHVHNTPSVFTTFTKTATGSQLISGQPSGDLSVAGKSWYDSLSTPRIHRVWNEDTTWFHVMDIELIGGKPHSSPPVLKDPFLQLYFNEPQANGYRLELQPGNRLELPASSIGYLLLSIGHAVIEYKTNDHVQHRIMKSGHYIWIEPGKSFSFAAQTNTPSTFVLLQLK
jgi:quercetin dioxygenase-like cupin family protein